MDTKFIGLRGLVMDSTIKHSLLLTNFLDYWGLSYDHKHSCIVYQNQEAVQCYMIIKDTWGYEAYATAMPPSRLWNKFLFSLLLVVVKVSKQINRKLEYCLCFYTLRSIKNKACVSRSMDGHWFLYPKTQVKRLSILTLNGIFHRIQSWN